MTTVRSMPQLLISIHYHLVEVREKADHTIAQNYCIPFIYDFVVVEHQLKIFLTLSFSACCRIRCEIP